VVVAGCWIDSITTTEPAPASPAKESNMQIEKRSSALATLAAAFLLAAPALAQSQPEALVIGYGTYLSANQQDINNFSYVMRQHGDGSASGFAVWQASGTYMLIELTSSMFVGNAIAMAGQFRVVAGNPPPPELGIVVGATAYFAVKDLGAGSADRTTGLSAVPAQFGNPTIQQIVGFGGGPPPEAFRPLLSGNIWIR